MFEVVTVNAKGEKNKSEWRQAGYVVEDLGTGIALELVSIPGGTFLMGSPEVEEGHRETESPQHEVTLFPFFMGKYPVTQAHWRYVAGLPRVTRQMDADPSHFKGKDHCPVEQVSWEDAVEFCDRLSKYTNRGYRLPSEAEWEYSCRAGTTTPFHFGETITSDLANYAGKETYGKGPTGVRRGKTTEVGSFPPNAFGLYDMHGNVWEWCADHWREDYQGAPTDGTAWLSSDKSSSRLLRGSSWDFNPWCCRSAHRGRTSPDNRGDRLGFRVCCSVPRTLQ